MEREEVENEIKDVKPLFPFVRSERRKNTLVMDTFLRKEHEGKYYLWHIVRDAYLPDSQTDYTSAISSFSRDVYMAMLFGEIDPELKHRDGTPVYELSENQEQSEKERLDPKQFFEVNNK